MVEQVDDQITYEIEWDRRTLDGMHPVYRKRCERDGLDPKSMGLDQDDIEPDDGTPVPIEQPTNIVTPPLSEKDQDDRVRMALGLTHDDPLPDVCEVTLLAYYRYLDAKLRFPFTAIHGEEEIGPFSRKRATLKVTGLPNPESEGLDVDYGLFCTCRVRDEEIDVPLGDIEVKKKDPNFKLVSDYAYWFHNWPCQLESRTELGEFEQVLGSDRPPANPSSLLKTVGFFGIAGGLLGATMGAALGTIPGARLAGLIGGIPAAMLGALFLGRYGFFFGVANRLSYSVFLGTVLGLICGGLLGGLAGLMVLAVPWSLAGFIVGLIVGPHLVAKLRRWLGWILGAVLGVCGGIIIVACQLDQGRAMRGLISGSVIGSISGVGLLIGLIGSLSLFPGGPKEHER
jgi:calcium binding protein